MRKCAAILCTLMLTGSLCACKQKAPTFADQPATTTTTTTAPTDEAAKTPLNLTYVSPFSDGVAFVRYLDADGVEQTAAINTAGDILFAVPEEMSIEGAGYKNGIRVVGDVVYDKTGAVIASPELSGYDVLMTGNCGGYVLAKKVVTNSLPAPTQESTSSATTTTTTTTTSAVVGDTTSATDASATATVATGTGTTTGITVPVLTATVTVGVLDNKGEWVQPLSADHPIAKAMAAAAQPTESLTWLDTDGVLMVYVDQAASPQYYDFTKNALTPDYAHYESVTYQDEGTGIYKVSPDGSRKLVIADVTADVLFKDVFVGRTTVENDKGEIESQVKLYDYTGKVLANLTDYPLWGNVYYYVYDRLVIPTDDGSGTRQLVVLGKDGKPAFDPVVLNMRDTFRTPDETGFVVETLTEDGSVRYCHYGWDASVTEYINVMVFGGFSDGLAAVTLTDGTFCYINHLEQIVIR